VHDAELGGLVEVGCDLVGRAEQRSALIQGLGSDVAVHLKHDRQRVGVVPAAPAAVRKVSVVSRIVSHSKITKVSPTPAVRRVQSRQLSRRPPSVGGRPAGPASRRYRPRGCSKNGLEAHRVPTPDNAKRLGRIHDGPAGSAQRGLDAARLAFEKMLTYANHVGLYSEEIGPSGEQLGNFPQAFTHTHCLASIRARCRQRQRGEGGPEYERSHASPVWWYSADTRAKADALDAACTRPTKAMLPVLL
jgi:hypothetical protein